MAFLKSLHVPIILLLFFPFIGIAESLIPLHSVSVLNESVSVEVKASDELSSSAEHEPSVTVANQSLPIKASAGTAWWLDDEETNAPPLPSTTPETPSNATQPAVSETMADPIEEAIETGTSEICEDYSRFCHLLASQCENGVMGLGKAISAACPHSCHLCGSEKTNMEKEQFTEEELFGGHGRKGERGIEIEHLPEGKRVKIEVEPDSNSDSNVEYDYSDSALLDEVDEVEEELEEESPEVAEMKEEEKAEEDQEETVTLERELEMYDPEIWDEDDESEDSDSDDLSKDEEMDDPPLWKRYQIDPPRPLKIEAEAVPDLIEAVVKPKDLNEEKPRWGPHGRPLIPLTSLMSSSSEHSNRIMDDELTEKVGLKLSVDPQLGKEEAPWMSAERIYNNGWPVSGRNYASPSQLQQPYTSRGHHEKGILGGLLDEDVFGDPIY